MDFLNIGDTQAEQLLQMPETGMGFQIVEATLWGEQRTLLVYNASIALDLTPLHLTRTDNPAVLADNEARIIDALRQAAMVNFIAPGPDSFRLLSTRVLPAAATSPAPTTTSVIAAAPSSLVKHTVLAVPRVFHRFSAFSPDRRVDPLTGDFRPGTYATPESEVQFVPTGFTAVGRFALPNNQPASNHYIITAPAQTHVSFGTVTPAFGQAGGGVEAYFASAVVNQPPKTAPSTIDDE